MKKFSLVLLAILFLIAGIYIPDIIANAYYGSKLKKIESPESSYYQDELELVFIYIGSSSCPASNMENLTFYIPELRKKMMRILLAKELAFIA